MMLKLVIILKYQICYSKRFLQNGKQLFYDGTIKNNIKIKNNTFIKWHLLLKNKKNKKL